MPRPKYHTDAQTETLELYIDAQAETLELYTDAQAETLELYTDAQTETLELYIDAQTETLQGSRDGGADADHDHLTRLKGFHIRISCKIEGVSHSTILQE